MSALSNVQITAMALNNGFKLKVQPDGALGLNPYVFEFARALLASQAPTVGIMAAELPVVGWMTEDGRIRRTGDMPSWDGKVGQPGINIPMVKPEFNIPLVRADQVERYVAALLQVAQIEAQQAAIAARVEQEPIGTFQLVTGPYGAQYIASNEDGAFPLYAAPKSTSDDARDAARWRFSAASCVTGSPEESIMSEIGNEWPDEDDTIRTSGEFTRFIDACMVALKDRQ